MVRRGRPLGRGRGSVFAAVGVAAQADDFGVVDQSVDHRGGDDVVAEDLTQRPKGLLLVPRKADRKAPGGPPTR